MDLLLNRDTHDLQLSGYDLALVSNTDLVRQRLKQSLWFFLGEWYLDIADGVPYYENILIKAPERATVESTLKTAILETPDVQELLNFEIDYSNPDRAATVTFEVLSTYGNVSVTVNI